MPGRRGVILKNVVREGLSDVKFEQRYEGVSHMSFANIPRSTFTEEGSKNEG